MNKLQYSNQAIRLIWSCFLFAYWLSVPVGASGQVSFEASTASQEVVQGSRFEVAFSLKNAEGTGFKAPNFGNLKPLGGASQSRGVNIFNGKSTTTQSWIFELEATRPGTYTIGPAMVNANGKTLATQPLSIHIAPPERTGTGSPRIPPGSDGQVFLIGELENKSVFSGQQLAWRVRLYTLVSIESFDMVELPDFEGFFHQEKRHFDTRTQFQVIKGKKYAVKTLHEEVLFPQQAGEVTVGEAQVRVGVERSGPMGAFLGPLPVLLKTQPVRLTVKALPEPTPANFSGCVGRYDWEVSADKDSLSTDDALTLTVTIRGNGDARHFTSPTLNLPSGLETFDPKIRTEDESEHDTEIVHSKTLDYVVLPKVPGHYALWPEFVFFDPDSNRYRILQPKDSLYIRVAPGAHYQMPTTQRDTSTLSVPPLIKQRGFWEHATGWLKSPLLWGLLLLCTLCVALLIWLPTKNRQKHLQPIAKPAPGKPAAIPYKPHTPSTAPDTPYYLNQARRLRQSDQPRAFYDALYHALQGWCVDHLQLPPAHLTQRSIRKELTRRNLPASRSEALLTAWQTCEAALFGGLVESMKMEETLRMAEEGMG